MTYRDILVQIDETPAAAARAITAAGLAAKFQAQLTGVFLKSEFLQNYMAADAMAYMSPSDIDRLLKEHAAATLKASEDARERFERAASEAGVVSDWQVIDGDYDGALIAYARRFDLTVMPPVATAALGTNRVSAADLGLASGGPVLVVGEGGGSPHVGKKILVAWKGTRESARALRDALPLLMTADEVHVLVVSPHGEGGPDGALQRHLERHGLEAKLIVDPSDDVSAAEVLRRQVKALQADLVVMGLYGRPRMQELVLGGVSQDLLRDPPAALLISH